MQLPEDRPPADALTIFDGGSTDALVARDGGPCRWPVRDGALVAQPDGGLWTRLHFRNAQVHCEFATPVKGEGNSGLYFHGLVEMQIINPLVGGRPPKHEIGSIYNMHAPLVAAGRAPGEWQSYDIVYIAPERDASGRIVKPGWITALLNCRLVQNRTEFREHVSQYAPLMADHPYADKLRKSLRRAGAAPLYLQDHGAPVRFRKLWIRPLDDKSHVFDVGAAVK